MVGWACLLGGVPGVDPANVVILGGGVVGRTRRISRLVWVRTSGSSTIDGSAQEPVAPVRPPHQHGLLDACRRGEARAASRLVIGGVLIPGAAAPKLVTAEMIKAMKPGSVVVDVAIDQGGCFETSHATTHADPTYVVDDVVHYCVANMPGAVPRTSTYALNNVTLPHVLTLADKGYKQALEDDHHLLAGLNVHHGVVTCKEVAEALDYSYVEPLKAMAA